MVNPQCCGIPKIFNDRLARRNLKRYRRKGPEKESRKLIEGIKSKNIEGMTLMDIGGGIGAVHLELIKAGISSVTDVDASPAYVAKAREESGNQMVQEKINYVEGDFTVVGRDLQAADIVTLDKVICCYNRMEEIVSLSLSKARRYYGIVFPKDNLLSKMTVASGNFILCISRNPFRSYIHPVSNVLALVESAGFRRVYASKTFVWRVEVFERVDS